MIGLENLLFSFLRNLPENSKTMIHTTYKLQGMSDLNALATELVRKVMGYLQGEDLPVALTNTRLLMIARSIHEDRTLCAQRKSAYLSSGALTTFVLNHGMVEVDMKLMNLTAKHGCLESMKILRAQSTRPTVSMELDDLPIFC